ncbi:MAG: efflux RND transporter periplasmic adaptor subunit [Candidatus Eremiobacteraeota bacterium]|nr:efflux RND transporter periplasmic adaptor subunit [Candidatus Eremiobacteraeota bacterium]
MKLFARVSIALAASLIAACAPKGPPPGAGSGAVGFSVPVSAAPIRHGDIVATFQVTGTVTPLQQASLSSVISGTVLSVNAQVGQRVQRGQLLVKIDDSTLRAQLQQNAAALQAAQARLASTIANSKGNVSSSTAGLQSARIADDAAQANLRRQVSLFSQGYVSQAALDQARQQAASADAALRSAEVAQQNAALSPGTLSAANADVRNAQAAVAQAAASVSFAESQIAQSNVSAPFNGVVSARHVDPGTLASPGQSLVDVVQLDHVYVDLGIPGDQISLVRVGSPVTISVSSVPGRSWHATVAFLSQAALTGTLSYQARIPISNADHSLRGGEVASVSLERQRKTGVLLAPRAAVFQTDAGFAMFVIDGGKAKSVPVETGLSNDVEYEVSGPGLRAGMLAILNHSPTLQPGMPVQVLGPQAQQHP